MLKKILIWVLIRIFDFFTLLGFLSYLAVDKLSGKADREKKYSEDNDV